MRLLLYSLVMLIPASAGAVDMVPDDQDLPQKVVRLEEKLHGALRQGDFDRVTQLLSQAERLESQLLEILQDPRRSARVKEGLRPLLEIIRGLRRDVARLFAGGSWRRRAQPKIERPPDPKLISVSPEEDGQAVTTGAPGAASDAGAGTGATLVERVLVGVFWKGALVENVLGNVAGLTWGASNAALTTLGIGDNIFDFIGLFEDN